MEKWKIPDKTKLTVILMAAAGVALLLFSGLGSGKEETVSYQDVGFYTEYLEQRIVGLCNSVEGVENAAVFLTLDCSSEYIYSSDGASDFLILSDPAGKRQFFFRKSTRESGELLWSARVVSCRGCVKH